MATTEKMLTYTFYLVVLYILKNYVMPSVVCGASDLPIHLLQLGTW